MNGLALLGLFLILDAVAIVVLTIKKPRAIWGMSKIKFFIKLLGDKGTAIFFYIFAAVSLGFGIWLLVR